jgi:hypothetical protein
MFAGATYCAFGQIPTVIQIDGSPRPAHLISFQRAMIANDQVLIANDQVLIANDQVFARH